MQLRHMDELKAPTDEASAGTGSNEESDKDDDWLNQPVPKKSRRGGRTGPRRRSDDVYSEAL